MESNGQKPEIRILNHIQGETLLYPLVLLEGIITTQDVNAIGHKTLLQTSTDSGSERPGKLQVLDTYIENSSQIDQEESSVLVKCGSHQMIWPIIRTGFKVVVSLDIGENTITLKEVNRDDIYALELKLIYTPMALPRYVCYTVYWNLVNMDTKGTSKSVRIILVSMLSRLSE